MISFESLKAGFKLQDPAFFRSWLKNVLAKEGNFMSGEIQYIFCDDSYLLKINRQFLKHNTLTDIITFSNTENKKIIAGDIFISIERVEENYRKFKTTFFLELSRVIVHGLLHLIGYRDNTQDEITQMRQKEDYYLNLQAQKIS